MGTVYSTESFLYEHFAVFGELFGKFGIVLFFLGMEAEIFQESNFAVFGFGYHFVGFGAYTVRRKMHRHAKQFFHFGGHGSQAKFRADFAFRAAQVGNEHYAAVVFQKVFDGFFGGDNAFVVIHFTVFQRYVIVHAYQNFFVFQVHILNFFDAVKIHIFP